MTTLQPHHRGLSLLHELCVRVFLLTVDLHSDGADGRDPVSVLSLAVVAPPLEAADVSYPQRFIVLKRVVETF